MALRSPFRSSSIFQNPSLKVNVLFLSAHLHGLTTSSSKHEVLYSFEKPLERSSLAKFLKENCRSGRFEAAWDLFQKFCLHGNLVPNVVTYSILINGLCNIGQVEKANELLSYMEEKGCAPDVVTFNTLIFGFLKNNKIPKVVEFLHKMAERNVRPTACSMSLVMQLLKKAENYCECLNQLPRFLVQKRN